MNFGRYKVEQKLGEDALGELFLVSSEERGPERVVLRLLRASLCRDPDVEKRCLDLVHALRLLPLPELVRPLAVGRLSDGRIYMTSEHVATPTLRERLAGGPLPPQLALHVGQTLALVLAAAHRKGLVHLSLRPECIYLGEDGRGGVQVRLSGLGLPRILRVRPEPSAVPYLAPELTSGGAGQGGAAADVHALGALLYEMLTGRNRLQSEGGAPPIPVDHLVPALGKGLSLLLQAMQARDPAQRPTMSQVAERLAQLEEGLLIGQTIGHYKIVGRIAQGGMGTVFRAIHEQIGRPAAIKILRSQFAQMPEVSKRFLNEARAVNLIRHPGLVQIFEFGQLPTGQPYLIMELLQGESLEARRLARGGSLPEGEALALAHQIAVVAAAAHAKAVIHRDLKPDNIMLVPDPVAPGGERVKLLDFGIAKVTQAQPSDGDATMVHTHAGTTLGTPGYMAPEQLSGAGGVTDRTDVYALGAILYELLTGKRPQEAAQEQGGVGSMSWADIPPVRRLAPHVSEQTEALLARMLAFLPAERPTMAEVAAQLEPAGRVPEPQSGTSRALGGRRVLIVAGAVGVVALAATVALWPPPRPRRAVPALPPQEEVAKPPPPPVVESPPRRPAPLEAQALRAQALAELRAALEDTRGEADVRQRAAAGLGRSRESAAVTVLMSALTDASPRVQGQAALALAALVQAGVSEPAAVVAGLVHLVETTTDGVTFVEAAAALEQLGDARGRKRLREALLSRDPSVRLLAARYLMQRGDREGRRALLRALANAAPAQQVEALGTLAEAGERGARGQLGALLTTEEETIRLQAAAQLARLGDETGRAALGHAAERAGAGQAAALRALAALRDGRACAELRRWLLEPQRPPAERALAAAALGDCGEVADAASLGQSLGTGPREVQVAAATAILHLLPP
ncbi:MAG: protein kinase [Myxococcota bacterium]|nr:protein kinase [Myxococcota bacterium]